MCIIHDIWVLVFFFFSYELRELEGKLRAAYMNKERAAQLAEKEVIQKKDQVCVCVCVCVCVWNSSMWTYTYTHACTCDISLPAFMSCPYQCSYVFPPPTHTHAHTHTHTTCTHTTHTTHTHNTHTHTQHTQHTHSSMRLRWPP